MDHRKTNAYGITLRSKSRLFKYKTVLIEIDVRNLVQNTLFAKIMHRLNCYIVITIFQDFRL